MAQKVEKTWASAQEILELLDVSELMPGQEYVGTYNSKKKYESFQAKIEYPKEGYAIKVTVSYPHVFFCDIKDSRSATFSENAAGKWQCKISTSYDNEAQWGHDNVPEGHDLESYVNGIDKYDISLAAHKFKQAHGIGEIHKICSSQDAQNVFNGIMLDLCQVQEEGKTQVQQISIKERLGGAVKNLFPEL